MASFDVESLFTNIPLQETIDLCLDLLFNDKPNIDRFTKTDFHELLTIVLFFSIRVFSITGQQGKGWDLSLFHATISTRSQTFRHLCATLYVR